MFNNAKITYEKALKNSGFTEGFTYIKPDNLTNINREVKKKRKRKIIWYNPPFSLNVKTNVGKVFFKMLRKNFPKTNPMSKIFNKNTVKISYSCTRNVKSIISGHNKQLLRPKPQPKGCNCRDKNTCPLENKCLTPKIIIKLMLSMTLMILTITIWDLQKHLSKIDTETIYHLLIMNKIKQKQNCLNMFGVLRTRIKFRQLNGKS